MEFDITELEIAQINHWKLRTMGRSENMWVQQKKEVRGQYNLLI